MIENAFCSREYFDIVSHISMDVVGRYKNVVKKNVRAKQTERFCYLKHIDI